MTRKSQLGLTMVELLIGLTISSFIIVGTVFVYSQSRSTYTLNDTQARLQEYGRFAIGVIEPDLQLAGYFGFSNNPQDLRYLAASGTEYPVSQLEQIDSPTVVASPTAIHSCGNNFVVDLLQTVEGTNNTYVGSGDCAAVGTYQTGSDTLTIRRAATNTAAASPTKIQLYVNALKRSNQYIFNSSSAPGPIDANREVHDLVVRKYYVSQNSDGRTGTPSLRRLYLTTDSSNPKIKDEEVLPGIEDMQVQFGVDAGDHNANNTIDNDQDSNGVPDDPNGVVSRWVNPGDNILKAPPAGRKAQVVAVRVWLRIRADDPDAVGYTDDKTYAYAGVSYTPSGAAAKFRRVLVSRTIYLRNARTL